MSHDSAWVPTMHSPVARTLVVTWFLLAASGAWALDEFDRHTSKLLREAAQKNAAVPTLSSGQASKLKTLGPRIEHACLVVRTTDGNWAKALVSWGFRKRKDAKGKDGLVPIVVLERYVTYDRDRGDATLAHGRNVMLFPGYEFDFDIGQIVPAGSGADVRFTPQRLIEAIDMARLHPVDGSVLPATRARQIRPARPRRRAAARFRRHLAGERRRPLDRHLGDRRRRRGGRVGPLHIGGDEGLVPPPRADHRDRGAPPAAVRSRVRGRLAAIRPVSVDDRQIDDGRHDHPHQPHLRRGGRATAAAGSHEGQSRSGQATGP